MSLFLLYLRSGLCNFTDSRTLRLLFGSCPQSALSNQVPCREQNKFLLMSSQKYFSDKDSLGNPGMWECGPYSAAFTFLTSKNWNFWLCWRQAAVKSGACQAPARGKTGKAINQVYVPSSLLWQWRELGCFLTCTLGQCLPYAAFLRAYEIAL